jgi:hypothetical protein
LPEPGRTCDGGPPGCFGDVLVLACVIQEPASQAIGVILPVPVPRDHAVGSPSGCVRDLRKLDLAEPRPLPGITSWLVEVPPGGIEPATHGLGNRCLARPPFRGSGIEMEGVRSVRPHCELGSALQASARSTGSPRGCDVRGRYRLHESTGQARGITAVLTRTTVVAAAQEIAPSPEPPPAALGSRGRAPSCVP